jgi:GntR family transcriptional regulator
MSNQFAAEATAITPAPDAVLDRDHATPLYHQLFVQLRGEILSGVRPHDSALPTEHELAAQHGVSRITARRALDELAAHGLVQRKRRVGTTVSFRNPQQPIEADIRQTLDSLITFGRKTEVALIDWGELEATGAVADFFALAPGQPISRVARVRLLDGEPLGYTVGYMPTGVGRTLSAAELNATPTLSLFQQKGLNIGHGAQIITAAAADPALAQRLAVEPQSPLLIIRRELFDTAGKPLLLTYAHYRADRYQIRLDLQGAG